jgi:CPA1 family monovalent cation:H+ antiporter
VAVFEWTLILLAAAVGLTAIARRIGAPYPSLLALGGTALALVNYSPDFQLDPSLVLALFVAPVLLDAAFDTSLRDLRANWIPVVSLVVIAVVITTGAVAALVHTMVPGIPWAAAIALGAIVAPPDAAAATAVLRPLRLPRRLVVILEGESLLNDASALMIYRVAVASLMSQQTDGWRLAPTFLLAIAGSVVLGHVMARVFARTVGRIEDAPSQIVLQFVGTFGIWLLADHLGLSPIVTIVVFGLTGARYSAGETPARLRVPSFAVWETVVFVLNVLAFILIGLQVRPILATLDPAQRVAYLRVALAVLFVVVAVRAGWIATYIQAALWKAKRFGGGRWPGPTPPTWKGAAIVIWCGMRGIVTLAAAYALPMASAGSPGVPYRDLIVLCAFGVVVGTLVLQGLTLRPLISALHIKADRSVDQEVHHASERLAHVALEALSGDHSSEARALRRELTAQINQSAHEELAHQPSTHDVLRARIVTAQRQALVDLRDANEIGDDAFHQLEQRLDWAELNAQAMDEA